MEINLNATRALTNVGSLTQYLVELIKGKYEIEQDDAVQNRVARMAAGHVLTPDLTSSSDQALRKVLTYGLAFYKQLRGLHRNTTLAKFIKFFHKLAGSTHGTTFAAKALFKIMVNADILLPRVNKELLKKAYALDTQEICQRFILKYNTIIEAIDVLNPDYDFYYGTGDQNKTIKEYKLRDALGLFHEQEDLIAAFVAEASQ